MNTEEEKCEEKELEKYASEKIVPADPPAEEKPVDINKEMNEVGNNHKDISVIINKGLNNEEVDEEYTEATSIVSQQSENMSRDRIAQLSREGLLAKLQSYQQMLEQGQIEQSEFDRLRTEIMSRI